MDTSFTIKRKQWKRKVARREGTVYWRVVAFDPLKRETLSDLRSFDGTP